MDTFETVKKQARNNVTLQISRTEIEWNSALAQTQGERTIALKSNQDTYNFMNCHRNTWDQAFFSHLPNISNSVKFAAHLFQLYWRQILVNMHPIIFGERYYDAYDDQKNYLNNEICKPFGRSPVDNKAFRRLDLLCKFLEHFPPPSAIEILPP